MHSGGPADHSIVGLFTFRFTNPPRNLFHTANPISISHGKNGTNLEEQDREEGGVLVVLPEDSPIGREGRVRPASEVSEEPFFGLWYAACLRRAGASDACNAS